jgi:hypothetical protein
MLDHLKKFWATHASWIVVLITFLDPSVKMAISHHPEIATVAGAGWAILLHNLTAPKNAEIVKDAKEQDKKI